MATSVMRWSSTDDFMQMAVCGIERSLARYWVGVPVGILKHDRWTRSYFK